MSDEIKLCRSCMNAVPASGTSCPSCGYDGRQQNSPESLPIGFRLAGRYVAGMRKGGDADTAVYVGYDCTLNRQVEIREYLPEGCCARESGTMVLFPDAGTELSYKTALMDFSDLYKNLNKIEGVPGIIRTSDFLEANGTAYAILDTFDGVTLREFLSMAGGSVSCDQALKILEPVFEAVEAIHKVNLIHRGISPDTILLNRNGDVRLGGFATSQVRTRGTEVPARLFGGYAAPEQYFTTSWQDTSTDVYALAAVFYRCVSGVTPQDAEQRRDYDELAPLEEARRGTDIALSGIIAEGMALDPQLRPQTAKALLSLLKAPARWSSRTAKMKNPGENEPGSEAKSASVRRNTRYPKWVERLGVRNFWAIVGSVLGIILLVTVTVVFGSALFGGGTPEPEPDPDLIKVPNYIGYTREQIEMLAASNTDLIFKYVEVTRTEGEDGVVVDQFPKPDTEVHKGALVTLSVTKLIKTVTVPNVVGDRLEVAANKLTALGIQFTSYNEVDDSLPEGVVIRQNPPGNTPGFDPEVSVVILYVCIHSAAPPPGDPSEPAMATPWAERREDFWIPIRFKWQATNRLF